MQRNKFIHAPSDAVLVTSSKISGKKKSGTWEGVVENLKYQWSPLYVIGNSEGVERLKAEINAKPFVSFEDIFKKQSSNDQTDSSNIEHQNFSLIELAIAKGIDKEEIERKFSEASDLYYGEKSEQEKLVVHEKQISMDEL